MKSGYWVKIRKTVTSMHNIDRPWLIKLYTPECKSDRDYVGTSRASTFEQAIRIAHQHIEYEIKLSRGLI